MINDDMMFFDPNKGRYILTTNCALSVNVDLEKELNSGGVPSKSNLPMQVLDRVSRTVYNFVYMHGNRAIKEAAMRDDDELRPYIKDAMIEQLLYFMANGDLNMTARVDISTGRELYRQGKLDAAYAPEMQNILNQTYLTYTGYMGKVRDV